jgi:hypothetical protein
LGDFGVNNTIILKLMPKEQIREYGLDSTILEVHSVAGCCEYCNEPSGSIRKSKAIPVTGHEGP